MEHWVLKTYLMLGNMEQSYILHLSIYEQSQSLKNTDQLIDM